MLIVSHVCSKKIKVQSCDIILVITSGIIQGNERIKCPNIMYKAIYKMVVGKRKFRYQIIYKLWSSCPNPVSTWGARILLGKFCVSPPLLMILPLFEFGILLNCCCLIGCCDCVCCWCGMLDCWLLLPYRGHPKYKIIQNK